MGLFCTHHSKPYGLWYPQRFLAHLVHHNYYVADLRGVGGRTGNDLCQGAEKTSKTSDQSSF